MKRLTINRIAAAGLRANRRAYRNLAAGIIASIFLAATLCLCGRGMMLAQRAQVAERVGWQDAMILDCNFTDSELRDLNLFSEIGTVTVTAQVTDTNLYLGYYDVTAAELLNRRCLEGRMPEASGELALEQSALDALRLSLTVGDEVRLGLTPVDGLPETRAFTLVGILSEQTGALDVTDSMYRGNSVLNFPTMITSPDEAAFASGRLVRHRLVTAGPRQVIDGLLSDDASNPLRDEVVVALGENGQLYYYTTYAVALAGAVGELVIMMIMLVAALLLACCVGIAGALESQLARKTEEIGLLRAVGATRRQIRRVFGREAWLLALIAAPLAIGLSCLLTWVLALIFPEQMVFRPEPWLLVPVLALSVAVILLASGLPLRRATRIMPMGVLRDTDLLRRFSHLKSRRQFKVSRLIAWRQLKLRPSRMVGSALLVCLMAMVVFLSTMLGHELIKPYMNNDPDFELYENFNLDRGYSFGSVRPRMELNASDIAQLRAIPQVASVNVKRQSVINLMVDAPTDYLIGIIDDFSVTPQSNWHLITDDPSMLMEYGAARRRLGTEKALVTMDLMTLDIDAAWLFEVTGGAVSLDDLNSGRAVLAYAPNYYMKREGATGTRIYTKPMADYDEALENDFYFPGQTLELAQLRAEKVERGENYWPQSEAEFDAAYSAYERRYATVTVGAVVDEFVGLYGTGLVTTHVGARALGLYDEHITEIELYLANAPELEAEQELEARITAIANRGDMDVRNVLARAREYRRASAQSALLFAAIAVVLLASAVAIIAGDASRRIRADVRKIGTLRAVGADSGVLLRCYSGQMWLSIGLGALMATVILLAMDWSKLISFAGAGPAYTAGVIGAEAVFLMLTAAICLWILRARIGEVTRHSIVDNIREL